jgi:hypothetical protein
VTAQPTLTRNPQLPSWFLQNPHLDPAFNLYFKHTVTRQEFGNYTQDFVNLYEKMWTRSQAFPLQREGNGDGDEVKVRILFQLFTYPPDDVQNERYVAHFVEYPDQVGFRVVIHESQRPLALGVGGHPMRPRETELVEDRFIQLPASRLLDSEDENVSENDNEDDWEDSPEDDSDVGAEED